MQKRSPSSNKRTRADTPLARRAEQIFDESATPDEPTVHHWLKAEAELNWKRRRQVTPQHHAKIDPKNPV